jgi:hypothetical protein
MTELKEKLLNDIKKMQQMQQEKREFYIMAAKAGFKKGNPVMGKISYEVSCV